MARRRRKAAHPTLSELRGLLFGELEPVAVRRIVAHLVRGCSECRDSLVPSVKAMFSGGRSEAQEPGPEQDYEIPLARAFASFRLEAERRATEESGVVEAASTAAADVGEITWARCEALLQASWALRHEDPEGMVLLAAIAVADAESIDPSTRGLSALADLQARAWAELGNARRVADDPVGAEADLQRARERAARGSGRVSLLARLIDLTASLYVEQRRFGEGNQLLDWAFDLYSRGGQRHLAGKVLVTQAISMGRSGEPEAAIELLLTALPLLDSASDPRVALICLHNLITFQVETGRFAEAWKLLWTVRKLYTAYGGQRHVLKLRWLEGRVAWALGHCGRAERCLRKAREGFLFMKLPYDAAVVALDLGILLHESGRTAEARTLIEDTLETFSILKIRREAVGAVILLTEAARQDQLTVAVLQRAGAELKKVEQ